MEVVEYISSRRVSTGPLPVRSGRPPVLVPGRSIGSLPLGPGVLFCFLRQEKRLPFWLFRSETRQFVQYRCHVPRLPSLSSGRVGSVLWTAGLFGSPRHHSSALASFPAGRLATTRCADEPRPLPHALRAGEEGESPASPWLLINLCPEVS